jgi:hypothetical protein
VDVSAGADLRGPPPEEMSGGWKITSGGWNAA